MHDYAVSGRRAQWPVSEEYIPDVGIYSDVRTVLLLANYGTCLHQFSLFANDCSVSFIFEMALKEKNLTNVINVKFQLSDPTFVCLYVCFHASTAELI